MREKILECIYGTLSEMKAQLNRGKELRLQEDGPIYDSFGPLDSIDLVRFIVVLEDELRARFGVAVKVVSASAFIEKKSPFRTIGSLATFLEPLLAASSRAT